MTVEEIIRLYNKEVLLYKNGDETFTRALTFDEVIENQNTAVDELNKKSKEELIEFIRYHYMKPDEELF